MKYVTLLPGEVALKDAPHYQISHNQQCIPQHYLKYNHNLSSVEQLIMDIEYNDQYPIFVSEDQGGLYLQVGIIGHDNYRAVHDNPKAKIVYGRKWRVEPQLPTSEIIQTAMLALKTAREHEIRELFRMTVDNKSTTPFNNHHDLPLLSQNQSYLTQSPQTHSWQELQQALDVITYDHASFFIHHIQSLSSNKCVVELEVLTDDKTKLPELLHLQYLSLVLNLCDSNELLFELMSQLIYLSNRHVEEHFQYAGTCRFSRSLQVDRIAELSMNTRQLHKKNELSEFTKQWQSANYETDLTRVPEVKSPALAQKIKARLDNFQPLDGVLPKFNLTS